MKHYFFLIIIFLLFSCKSEKNIPRIYDQINWHCQQGKNDKGDIKKSIFNYEEAYTLLKSLPDSTLNNQFLNDLYFPLANLYKSVGETYKARKLFVEALSNLANTTTDSASVYNQIGLTYKIEGKQNKAIESFKKGLILRPISTLSEGLLLSSLAISIFALEQTQQHDLFNQPLVDTIDKAIELLEFHGGNENALEWKANMYKLKGQQLLMSYSPNKPKKRQLAELEQALSFVDKGIPISTGRTKCKLLVDKGRLINYISGLEGIHGKERLEQLLIFYNDAIKELIPTFLPNSPIDNPNSINLYTENTFIELLSEKAAILFKLDQLSPSKKNQYNQAFYDAYDKIYQVERKMWQLHEVDASKRNSQKHIRTNQEYILDKAFYEDFRNKSFEAIERMKSMTLLGVIRKSKAEHFGLPESVMEEERKLRALISNRSSEIIGSNSDYAKQQYSQFIRKIEKDYPTYYQLKYDDKTITISEIQDNILKENQGLIEYTLTDKGLYIVLIKKDTSIHYLNSTVNVEKLTPLIHSMRNSISNYNQLVDSTVIAALTAKKTLVEVSNKLSKNLIPFFSNITDLDKLIIIPDGILGYLPFDALLINGDSSLLETDFSGFPFLVKDFQLVYSYSATLLQEMTNKTNKASKEFLAFAPIFTSKSTFDSLQYNQKEITTIGKKIGKEKLLFEKDACIYCFQKLAKSYRIIHFATHGKADDLDGDSCWIALTPIETEKENRLFTKELYNYRLNADLVTISACETAIGEVDIGEGIIGITRAFAYAGAKSLMTTLWKVDEGHSKSISISFYNKLKEHKLSKDKALQLAKIEMINNPATADPFCWAGHVLIGDASPVFSK